MQPEIRRIIAVEAHRRRTGRCPVRVHSLGTGETFDIQPADRRFLRRRHPASMSASTDEQILVPSIRATIDLSLEGDVGFRRLRSHQTANRFPAVPVAAPRSRSTAADKAIFFSMPSPLKAIPI